MKIKITNPKYGWHRAFKDRIFDVLTEDMIEGHHQYPVMTACGRTWFDKDSAEVLQ